MRMLPETLCVMRNGRFPWGLLISTCVIEAVPSKLATTRPIPLKVTVAAPAGVAVTAASREPSWPERSCTRISPAAAFDPAPHAKETTGAAAAAEATSTSQEELGNPHSTKRAVVLFFTASVRVTCKPFNMDSAAVRICWFCIHPL